MVIIIGKKLLLSILLMLLLLTIKYIFNYSRIKKGIKLYRKLNKRLVGVNKMDPMEVHR